MRTRDDIRLTRRTVVKLSWRFVSVAALASNLPDGWLYATPLAMQEAIRAVVGTARLLHGKVALDLPPLVENGNAVPMAVAVDSSMTPNDFVKAIHVFNEKNPQPHVLDVQLGPRAGRARISTRIRLADSQKIVALAELSDGSFWATSVDVIVTLAACIEGPS